MSYTTNHIGQCLLDPLASYCALKLTFRMNSEVLCLNLLLEIKAIRIIVVTVVMCINMFYL